MKKYGIVHNKVSGEVATFDDLRTANEVAKSMGPDFSTVTWIGFGGLPAAACVMRNDGQLEAICLYRAEAEMICKSMKDNEMGLWTYEVRMVMLNTSYPHTHGEYSV